MIAEEREEHVRTLQDATKKTFEMLLAGDLTAEQGKAAVGMLQLLADLLDLSDSLARRSQAR
jgi:hypothetical protein